MKTIGFLSTLLAAAMVASPAAAAGNDSCEGKMISTDVTFFKMEFPSQSSTVQYSTVQYHDTSPPLTHSLTSIVCFPNNHDVM